MRPLSAAAAHQTAYAVHCFSVVAALDPGIAPRILALFAKRGMMPSYWCGRADDAELAIDLQVREVDSDTALYLAACFRQIPGVRTVLTSQK